MLAPPLQSPSLDLAALHPAAARSLRVYLSFQSSPVFPVASMRAASRPATSAAAPLVPPRVEARCFGLFSQTLAALASLCPLRDRLSAPPRSRVEASSIGVRIEEVRRRVDRGATGGKSRDHRGSRVFGLWRRFRPCDGFGLRIEIALRECGFQNLHPQEPLSDARVIATATQMRRWIIIDAFFT